MTTKNPFEVKSASAQPIDGTEKIPAYHPATDTPIVITSQAIITGVGDLIDQDFATQNARITAAEGDIAVLESEMNTAQADIDALEVRVTTIEADIATLQTETADAVYAEAVNLPVEPTEADIAHLLIVDTSGAAAKSTPAVTMAALLATSAPNSLATDTALAKVVGVTAGGATAGRTIAGLGADLAGDAAAMASIGAGATTVAAATGAVERSIARETISIKDFGAGLGAGVDATAAFMLAATWLNAGDFRTLHIPNGNYPCSSTIALTRASAGPAIVGESQYGSRITNNCVNKLPLISISSAVDYGSIERLTLYGNGLTGLSGNGNAISVLGSNAAWVNSFHFKDLTIRNHLGTGADVAGSSISAHGIYCYAALDCSIDGIVVTGGTAGILLDGGASTPSNKILIKHAVMDVLAEYGIKTVNAENVSITNECVFNNIGTTSEHAGVIIGGAFHSVKIVGNRFKLCAKNSVLINPTAVSGIVTVKDNFLYLEGADLIGINSNTIPQKAIIDGNEIFVISASTNTIGILVTGSGGYLGQGYSIVRNSVWPNGTAVIEAGIRVISSGPRLRCFEISQNEVGYVGTPSGAGSITNGISIDGNISGFTLLNNTGVIYAPATGGTGLYLRLSSGNAPAGTLRGNNAFFFFTNAVQDNGSSTVLGVTVV